MTSFRLCLLAGVLVGLLLAPHAGAASSIVGREVPDFALLDARGNFHQLRRSDAKAVVLFFTATGCPIARQCVERLKKLEANFGGKGVQFWMVNSNSGDDRESVYNEAKEFGANQFVLLMDETLGVAALLDVKRTSTVVCIETSGWKVIYHGAIDDQLVEGAQKPEPTERYLESALVEFIDGKPVSKPKTLARGCLIRFGKEPVSYSEQVGPLIREKCFGCHSPGNIGTPKFTSYQTVHGMADMIQEVVLARRMPPWHADRHHGEFINDRSLSLDQARLLLRWIEQGAPRGEGEDPLASAMPPSTDWVLGQPDVIVSLPKPERIPATGVLGYRHVRVAAPFDEDVWVRGIVAKPDNTRVVHHIILRAKTPGQKGENQDDAFLIGWAPGSPEIFYPEGTSKRIKKGSELDFEMHYTTSGKEETDQSSVGIYLMKEKPRMVLKTQAAVDVNFEIPPRERAARTLATYMFQKESYLFDMFPHMHLRGSSFKFEALYPNGDRELLLFVPKYDFNWQHTYRLKEPKRMPAGTWILCTGAFDISPGNPHNPSPGTRVHWGDQSFEEMFIGFMSVAEIPEEKPLSLK